jgi:hypothetical protein
LVDGNPPAVVARKLGIFKSLERYYRVKALEYGLIKRINNKRPFLYCPGVNYEHLGFYADLGGSGRRILTPSCRLHPPQGNAFTFPLIKEGEQHELRSSGGERYFLFDKDGGRNASLTFPTLTPGSSSGRVKINAHGASLVLSAVPELRIYAPSVLECLLALGNGPYGLLLDWVVDLFTSNGWRLGPPSLSSHYHFAFDLEMVSSICPELLKGVPFLGRGQEENDLILWCDRSHGCPEIETTDPDVALELLTILHARHASTHNSNANHQNIEVVA